MHRLTILLLAVVLGACHVKGGIIHRVERGESLLQISHAYGVSLEEILRANSIQHPDRVKEGEKLLIPGARESKSVKKFVWEKAVPQAVPSPRPSADRVKKKPVVASKRQERDSVDPEELKFAWPAKGRILVPFGMVNRRMHNGIDLSLKPNEPIRAAMQGTVAYRGDQVDGYGNMLILRHPENLFSVYAYLGRFKAEKGDVVKQGDIIAHASENKNLAFIHFEIRRGKHAVNPMKFLPAP